jgi:hypothetical protein
VRERNCHTQNKERKLYFLLLTTFPFLTLVIGLSLSHKIIIDTLSLGRSLHGASVRHEEASRFFLWRVYCLYVEWQTLGGWLLFGRLWMSTKWNDHSRLAQTRGRMFHGFAFHFIHNHHGRCRIHVYLWVVSSGGSLFNATSLCASPLLFIETEQKNGGQLDYTSTRALVSANEKDKHTNDNTTKCIGSSLYKRYQGIQYGGNAQNDNSQVTWRVCLWIRKRPRRIEFI